MAIGTDYQLWFTGSNPGHLRFHLLNTYGGPSDTPGEGVRISIWYKNPQRKDVYKVVGRFYVSRVVMLLYGFALV